MLVQELQQMTADQLQRIAATHGDMMVFPDGWGINPKRHDQFHRLREQMREKSLAKGAETRNQVISMMENGKEYTARELFEKCNAIFKNKGTLQDSLTRYHRQGFIEKAVYGLRVKYFIKK